MGQAVGNLQEYWDVIENSKGIVGGCIWDWVDQGIYDTRRIKAGEPLKDPKTGIPYYTSGYDFTKMNRGDYGFQGDFMSNGIITPGREWTAKLDEVKYVYRDVDFVSFANHKLTLKNKFAFTNLSDYQLVWSISGRGEGESNLAHGAVKDLQCKPGETCVVEIPYDVNVPADKEFIITFKLKVKDKTAWANRAHVIAAQQFRLTPDVAANCPSVADPTYVQQNHIALPVINKKVREKICDQVTQAFGGNFYEIIIGGAAFNQEVESFLHSIGFRYTVGYGATECAPIICYEDYKHFVPGSCGKAAKNMMVKIDSPDPENVPGEILAKGPNVMLGYYKNEEATATTLDKEGWYHTGDLGTMDGDGNVFIKGRSKNMLLGASGQNIYPEEIEDKLNSLALVSESVVVQKGNKLIGLVYPDFDEAQSLNLGRKELEEIMEQNRQELNAMIPAYSKISEIRIHDEEFEKTPKKSIKRFLYTAE